MAPMEARVSKETLTALNTDRMVRCVLTAHFKGEKSRHSKNVIAWAQSRAEKASSLLLRDIEQPTPEFSVHLYMVQMLHTSSRVYICYDIFLAGCDEQLREEIEKSLTSKRPVHQMIKRGNVCHVTRNKEMDQILEEQDTSMREYDKGPFPLFYDSQNPPHYSDGVRVEEDEQQEDEHDPSEPVEAKQNGPANPGDGRRVEEAEQQEDEHDPSEPVEAKQNGLANPGDGKTEHRPANEEPPN